jgi:hypothetical protein
MILPIMKKSATINDVGRFSKKIGDSESKILLALKNNSLIGS